VPHTVNSQEPLALAQAALAQRTTLRRRLIAELRNEANFSRNPNKMKPLASLRRPRRTHLPPKPPLPRRTEPKLRPIAELRNEPNSSRNPNKMKPLATLRRRRRSRFSPNTMLRRRTAAPLGTDRPVHYSDQGGKPTISEIRLGGTKTKLVFTP
jgi:hypothetical protein